MTAVRHVLRLLVAPSPILHLSNTDSGAPTFDSQKLLTKEGKKNIRSGMLNSSYDLFAEKLDPDQELRSDEDYLISSRSNLDLFVMAHEIESRDTVEAIRTRMMGQDFIDSPTSAFPMNQVGNVETVFDSSETW